MTTRARVTRTSSGLRPPSPPCPRTAAAAHHPRDSSLVKMKDGVMTLRFVPSPLCQTITTNLRMKLMANIPMPTGNDYTLFT